MLGKGVQDDFLVSGPCDQAKSPAMNGAILEMEQPRLLTPLGIFLGTFLASTSTTPWLLPWVLCENSKGKWVGSPRPRLRDMAWPLTVPHPSFRHTYTWDSSMFPSGSRPDLPFCRTILHWREALIKTHQVSDLPGALGKSNRGKKTTLFHNLNKIHLHHQKKRYNTKTPLPTCPFPSPHKVFKAVVTQALRF